MSPQRLPSRRVGRDRRGPIPDRMKKLVPLLALVFAIGFAAKSLRPAKHESPFDIAGFSQLPVLVNGRLKPLDTVARSSLLQLQGRQRVSSPTISAPLVSAPIEWLIEVMFRAEKADTFPTFAIDNPDLLERSDPARDPRCG